MRLLGFVAFFLVSFEASAQLIPDGIGVGATCPGTSYICQPLVPNARIVFDFSTQAIPTVLSYSRASSGWFFNSSGLLTSAGTNVPRFDYGTPASSVFAGLLLEPPRTNYLLSSRDLTQTSYWTANTATVALNQTGLDGVANSASSITATAANATVCQTITQSAASSVFSVYLKRISGTGAISISQDGGATYTTETLTPSWLRFAHAAESTANPGICIKLATSGDEIAVDATQFEVSYATSPMLTTSSTFSRAGDSLTYAATLSWFNANAGSFVYEWEMQNNCGASGGTLMQFTYSSGNTYGITMNNTNLEAPTTGKLGTVLINAVNKAGVTYSSPNGSAHQAFNNVLYSNVAALAPASTGLIFGKVSSGCGHWARKLTYWNTLLTPSQLQSATD